jgi:hypothetical protein
MYTIMYRPQCNTYNFSSDYSNIFQGLCVFVTINSTIWLVAVFLPMVHFNSACSRFVSNELIQQWIWDDDLLLLIFVS